MFCPLQSQLLIMQCIFKKFCLGISISKVWDFNRWHKIALFAFGIVYRAEQRLASSFDNVDCSSASALEETSSSSSRQET